MPSVPPDGHARRVSGYVIIPGILLNIKKELSKFLNKITAE
jgi:hypothetical protein